MTRWLAVTLGILTAIGGFVDIGDLVTNALVGARFGLRMAWVVVVGVIGICVFAEMSGRVVAMSGRPVFDLIRERLGPRTGLFTLVASFLVTLMTLTAEIGGIALALELASDVFYLLWAPLAALAVWLVIWRVRFSHLEQVFGLLGLLLVVFAVALWRLGPDWGALFSQATSRANVFIGFPLGGLLSLAIAGTAAVVFEPAGIQVDTLGQVALPVAVALGKIGFAVVLVGIFAATFGAALETALSCGYTIAQYFGWQWGKFVRPKESGRFHLVMIVALVLGTVTLLTTVDPVKVTEFSVVFAAMALPLTYLPILIVANDPDYMGNKTNGRLLNVVALGYLGLLLMASLAAIPLMIWTRAGR